MGRIYYQVRVRERIGPNWVKKSKFFFATSSQDAASKYRGPGSIIKVEKVSKERLFGVGEFFVLGDEFLRELKSSKEVVNGKEATDKFRGIRRETET